MVQGEINMCIKLIDIRNGLFAFLGVNSKHLTNVL